MKMSVSKSAMAKRGHRSDQGAVWEEVARQQAALGAEVVRRLAPLDPTRHLARATGLPVLFQFATCDKFVTKAAAESLVASAAGPAEVRWYDAEHALNAAATRDRLTWLRARLFQ